ncbi:thiamine pyrophosphate-dependent dehydrogenase E1 component subunit alpha [Natronolimnobius sp. AArcel1]|uniref:thiamine pyrophosphate-dependent dehydrogenase E1 component subunit alpha n=1 Tax=Natronolimnobius sp. AArcel1 TaxID=1679093 RepID=UPI0013ED7857|nr:thiamine pyrophosphate-dependent dehydrogenase E1 component subunit alpha [Natronolimnobius sp. AArcel1]NGM68279.1 thiamine pyrophosphate-dependent dehydrogenase E1 component subunit alpha [Natronolimnobius sp. AArcel1]
MHRVIADRDLSATRFDADDALACFRDMVRARQFDDRAVALQRRGWMSGYPPFRGQEASQVGAAHALLESDWLVPTYRSNAMQLAHGVPMADIFRFRRGYPEYTSEHDLNVFPQAVPIATQIPHAVGLGMALEYDSEPDGETPAVCCYLGDGATSEGDFHEGLNFAGVFDAPVVFFCENNGWAISMPRERQTASATLAQKAEAYGFEGVRVDGNDPLAVQAVMLEALEAARNGDPVLVESLTYRQGAHTTSDDPSRYRDDAPDLPDWRTADPLERFETYLRDQGVLDDALRENLVADANAELEDAVDEVESAPLPDPDDVFESVYEDMPPRLAEQRAWLEAFASGTEVRDLEY